MKRPSGSPPEDGHCAGHLAQLSASLDSSLSAEASASLASHLEACPRCAARKAALLAQADALRAASERRLEGLDLSGFSARVLRAIARDGERPGVLATARQAGWVRASELWGVRRVRLLASAGAAACAALLLLLPAGPPARLPGVPVAAPAGLPEARASVESLDVSGATYAVLDLEGAPTTVIWVAEEGD